MNIVFEFILIKFMTETGGKRRKNSGKGARPL